MRAMEEAMRVNAAALAERVRSRDPGEFATVLDSGAGMNPVYRAWLAIRGKRPDIDAARAVAPSGKVVA